METNVRKGCSSSTSIFLVVSDLIMRQTHLRKTDLQLPLVQLLEDLSFAYHLCFMSQSLQHNQPNKDWQRTRFQVITNRTETLQTNNMKEKSMTSLQQ